LVASERFKCITHYFPTKGHSFLPCETNFARIAKIKRKKEEVETPREWEDIVKNEANFNVETFKNTDNTLDSIIKCQRSAEVRSCLFQSTKYLSNSNKFPGKVTVTENMRGTDFVIYSLMKNPFQHVTFSNLTLYANTLPIKSEKLENLKRLVKYLSPAGAALYSSHRIFST
ncbi:hypothetical protein ANN_15196, partial [Periplaneta americana]